MRPNLIEARKRRNMTQAVLGGEIGLSPQSICDLEKGRTVGRVATWDKLAAVLKTPARKLREIAQ